MMDDPIYIDLGHGLTFCRLCLCAFLTGNRERHEAANRARHEGARVKG